jgi:hypothetical protein
MVNHLFVVASTVSFEYAKSQLASYGETGSWEYGCCRTILGPVEPCSGN